jgi:hypothetical protein
MKKYSFLSDAAQSKSSHQMLAEYRQDMARHLQTQGPAVNIPLEQAKIEGMLTGMLTFLLALIVLLFGLPYTDLPWWYAALALPLGVCVGLWRVRSAFRENLSDWRALVWQQEERDQVDWNGDGHIGQPEKAEIKVYFPELKQDQNVDLPVSMDKVTQLARGIVQGRPFTEREWTGAGKPLTEDELETIREKFLAKGWVRWINDDEHRQGMEFTAKGLAVMKGLASQTPYPAPVNLAELTPVRTHAARTHDFDGGGRLQ